MRSEHQAHDEGDGPGIRKSDANMPCPIEKKPVSLNSRRNRSRKYTRCEHRGKPGKTYVQEGASCFHCKPEQ